MKKCCDIQQYCNSTKQYNKTQNIVITYKMELIQHNITQYNVLYHIVKNYHTKYSTLQYFVLKYTLNILQTTTLFKLLHITTCDKKTPHHTLINQKF